MHKIGKFLMQMLHVFRHRIRDWLLCNGSGADETKTEGLAACKTLGRNNLGQLGPSTFKQTVLGRSLEQQ